MTDHTAILWAIVRRLRDNLGLNDRTCWLTDLPADKAGAPSGASYWLTVSPGDGEFDESTQIGGAVNQVTENAGVIVTGYTRIRLDSTARNEKLLTDLNRGLLPIKQKILAGVLVGDQPLTDELGNPLAMRALVMAARAERPAYDVEAGIGWVSVHFATPFDWDLTNVL